MIRNNNFLKELGNKYEYVVGLEILLSIKDKQRITMQKYGDITVYEGKKLISQIECKHSIDDSSYIEMHDKDFYNSIENWILDPKLEEYEELNYYAVGRFKENKKFKDWNNLSLDERISLLDNPEITTYRKDKSYKNIENLKFKDREKLKIVFNKLKIIQAIRIDKKIEEIKSKLRTIPEMNREEVLIKLIGIIFTKNLNKLIPVDCSSEEFYKEIRELGSLYTNNPKFLYEYHAEIGEEIKIKYRKRKFYKKIEKLEAGIKIAEKALLEYWNTLIFFNQYSEYGSISNTITKEDCERYLKSLEEMYISEKVYIREINIENIKAKSLEFYKKIMEEKELKLLGDFRRDYERYIQKGSLHKLANEKDEIIWLLEDLLDD